MIDLRDRKLKSVVLSTLCSSRMRGQWQNDLLSLGIDPEKLYASAFLLSHLRPSKSGISMDLAETILHERKSDFGARVALAVSKAVNLDSSFARQQNSSRLLGFIRQGNAPPDAPRVDPEIERQLVSAVIEKLPPEDEWVSLGNMLARLGQTRRPEFADPIREFAGSPYDFVARQAAGALKLLGEQVAPLNRAPVTPVKFVIDFESGTPAPTNNTSIVISPVRPRSELAVSVPGRVDGGSIEFGHDPVLALSRQAEAAELVLLPNGGPGLEALRNSIWARGAIDFPIHFDAPNHVSVQTVPLTVRLKRPRPAEYYADRNMVITVTWLDLRDVSAPATFEMPAAAEFTLPRLAPGNYVLEVKLPGAGAWQRDDLQVTRGMQPVIAKLKRAVSAVARVKFPTFRPDESLAPFAMLALSHDLPAETIPFAWVVPEHGETMISKAALDRPTSTLRFEHLPPGKYRLRVPGAFAARPNFDFAKEPGSAGWSALEMPFEVPPGVADDVDLGEIVLVKETQ